MKKITLFLFTIIFLLLLATPNTNCITNLELPSFYIEEGIGDNSLLENKDLELISGYVEWGRSGTYKVVYQDSNNNVYTKKIIVLPNDNEYYTITKEREINIQISSFHNVIDVFYISDSSFYIISNYQNEEENGLDHEKISVCYYENYTYKWEYRYYKYSKYVSGVLYNDNLIITGLVYNDNNYYINSIVLFEITKERSVIKSREIKSNSSCFVHNVFIDNDNIYLITNANGNMFDYETLKKDNINRLVIFKINYKTFKIIEAVVNDTLENFIVVDASYYDRRITVNVLLRENKGIYTNCIYEYNDELEFINEYYFSLLNKDYLGHQVTSSELCIYTINNFEKEKYVTIEYLNFNVDNKQITLDLQNNYVINNIKVVHVDGNSIYFSMHNKSNITSNFIGYCKVESTNDVTYYPNTSESINIIETKICNNLLTQLYYKDGELYTRIENFVYIRSVKVESEKLLENIKKVYVNFIEINKEQYYINFNKSLFGLYKDLYIFTDNYDNTYILQDEVTLKFDCNINNNEVYQIGQKLLFNGEGLLNGDEIKSEYIINDVGKYQLVISGLNETKIILFEVKDLTLKPITYNKMNNLIESVEIKNHSNMKSNDVTINYDYVNKDNTKQVIPLAITILCFGIIGFFFVRKKI